MVTEVGVNVMPKRKGHLMAVHSLKVVVCDQCGTDAPTDRYTIVFPEGNRRTFDLCEQCGAPVAALGELAVAEGRGPKGHGQPVLTQKELEARVKGAHRGTKKRV